MVTDFGGRDAAVAVGIDAAGRISSAGSSASATGEAVPEADFALARYGPDGSPDPGFGTDGKVLTNFGRFDEATALALLPGGGAVVVGWTHEKGDRDFAVARYLD